MAVSTTYFNPLSFQQAAPVVSGMQAGADISQQMGLAALQRQQAQTAAITNRFLPQSTQANIALTQAQTGAIPYQNQLAQAQTGVANATAQNIPYQLLNYVDPITRMRMSQQIAQRLNGGMPGQVAGGIPPITSTNGGMTIQPAQGQQPQPMGVPYSLAAMSGAQQQAPQTSQYQTLPGGMTPQQGQQVAQQLGAQPVPAGQPAAAMQAIGMPSTGSSLYDNLYGIQLNNMLQQLGKNPAFGGKYGAGSTNINPLNGQPYTTDTQTNTSFDQQTLAALPRIQPQLDALIKNLPQFQTLAGKASLYGQQFGNLVLGQKGSLPDQYEVGQQALKTAPESMIKAWGLKVTNEALDRMQEAIEPGLGETPQGYTARIVGTLNQLKENAGQSSDRLASGQDLQADIGNPVNQTSAGMAATIKMKTPDGKVWNVPMSKYMDAVSRGASQA
jgi:hypothetical protein